MLEGLAEILKSSSLSPVVFPVAFLLGLVGAVTSCCTLPVLGAIVGYSGTLADNGNRRALLHTALPFMLGTMGAFAAWVQSAAWSDRWRERLSAFIGGWRPDLS